MCTFIYVKWYKITDFLMRRVYHNPKYNTRINNVAVDAVIVNRNDWRRTKKEAVHLTPEQRAEMKRREEEEKMKTMETITMKRRTVLTPEISNQTRLRTKSTLNAYEDKKYAIKIAEEKADEDIDEIKTIKSLMVAAEARTERDKQLIENEEIRKKKIEEKKWWDEKLEKNRLTAIKLYDDREKTLREQRIKGRRIIEAQIEEHKINKILEDERKDRERMAVQAQNAFIAEEDRRILMEKKKRQQDFLHDCLQANEAQRKRKIELREREKEEVEMVIEFAAQKALKEEAYEAEKAAKHALLEREWDALRRRQKRDQDYRSARDEKNALKVQKERDEQLRLREERDKKRIEDMKVIVAREREEMIRIHKQRLEEEKRKELEEHKQLLERNRIARQKAREEYEKKLAIDAEYRAGLKLDMEAEWEAKRINPQKKIEEARANKEANDQYLAKLDVLREKKLDILRKKGVPDKYLVDIQKLRWEIK